jgi:hypothetical protein
MKQALFVNESYVGDVLCAYGGINKGVVTSTKTRGAISVKKRLSGVNPTPLVLNTDLALDGPVCDWISKSWINGREKRKCSITLYNSPGQRSYCQWNFLDACISEVEIPACDRSKQEPGSFKLTIVPSKINYETVRTLPPGSSSPVASSQWLLSEFRVEIGNLPCNRVKRIESFTWKQQLVGVSQVVVPDLMLTIPFSDIQPWEEWFRKSVIEGTGDKKSGCSIQLLGHNMHDVRASIGLERVGIFSFGMESTEAENREVNNFQVGLYCEQMSLGI